MIPVSSLIDYFLLDPAKAAIETSPAAKTPQAGAKGEGEAAMPSPGDEDMAP